MVAYPFRALLVVVALGLLLGACAPAATAPAAPQAAAPAAPQAAAPATVAPTAAPAAAQQAAGKTKIRATVWVGQAELDALAKMTETYQKTHPNIDVEW